MIHASPGGRRGRGGIARFVSNLADALPAALPGVRIEVLDTYGPGAFWAMPATFLVAVAKVIVWRLRGRADLLHLHAAAHGSAIRKSTLSIVASALGIPTVMHLHGSVFDDYFRALPPWRRRVLSRVLRGCSRVIVIGTHWRTFAIREVGLDPERVVLVHNGVRTVHRDCREAEGHCGALLMLGQLGVRKGTPELIEALASPELRDTRWTATLAGNGPVDRFRATVAALGLSDRIILPGWQSPDEVRALLRRSDILVLPSHDEGLPMAILEAMAAGIAVIATPVGAIPDAITDGETGLLVAPGDPAGLARAIRRLLDDAALRRRLAANGRARCERMFSIDRTASAIAAIYEQLGVGQRPVGQA